MAFTVLRWSGFHSATRCGDMYGQRLSLPLIMHSDPLRKDFFLNFKCSITRRNHYNIPLYIIGPRRLMQTPREISLPLNGEIIIGILILRPLKGRGFLIMGLHYSERIPSTLNPQRWNLRPRLVVFATRWTKGAGLDVEGCDTGGPVLGYLRV